MRKGHRRSNVVLLQEVVAEMYAVVRRRLPDWKVHRRRPLTEEYYNVTAVRPRAFTTAGGPTSYAFPDSENGRHVLTVRRDGWAISTVHTESGGRQQERDRRVAQL